MPNCDWYGTVEDHRIILDFLFQEKNCLIYELYSDYEKPLKLFSNTNEIIEEFERTYPNNKKWNTIYLNIYAQGSGPKFKPRKIRLDPKKCQGATFRYSADGLGMIQLYLSVSEDGKLKNSHTNHNSFKRIEKWREFNFTSIFSKKWNFEIINKFSNKLVRKIRSMAYAKIGSRIITENAFLLWENGYSFDQYKKETDPIEILLRKPKLGK